MQELLIFRFLLEVMLFNNQSTEKLRVDKSPTAKCRLRVSRPRDRELRKMKPREKKMLERNL
jgi:hypothetical protein